MMDNGKPEERGQALIEYALIVLVIVIVVWVALMFTGAQIGDFLNHIATGL